MPVVRIANAKVPHDQLDAAEHLLAESEAVLRGPLQELAGFLHFYAGIDRELGYLTNLSVWETLEDAHQLDSLQAMRSLRPSFQAAGVNFEPVTNHEVRWSITA